MNDLIVNILRTRVRIPPPPPSNFGDNMFNWFKKIQLKKSNPSFDFKDSIEEALWEIKEEYDLETEEVERTVYQKRHNINYMNECIKNNQ